MKKLIFNITQSNVKGGMENIFVEYAKILNNDFEVICLTSTNFPENHILDKERITKINLNIKGHFDILASIKIFFLIKKYRPNLIIAHNGRSFATINILKKFFGLKIKTLAISHGGNPKRLINFNYIITVAKHIENKINESGFKGTIKTIYNGIHIKQKISKIQKNSDNFVFGAMSRLSKEKNIDLTIKAFAKFVNEVNKDSKLIIAGEGVEKEELINLAKELKIEEKIEFIGWVKNLENFFINIDLFIHSSFNEAFGIVIIESFKYNCPVLVSDSCGPKEIVEDRQTGFLFDPNESNSLYFKMKEIYLKRKELNIIKDNAFKILNEKFSYEIMANSLIKFVNSII